MSDSKETDSFISLKEILVIVKSYSWELLKYSWIIVIVAFIFGKYMYSRKMSSPTIYTGDLSFVFNEVVSQTDQSVNMLFGKMGGASESKTPNLAKVREVFKTRKIVLKVLFHKASLKHEKNGEEDFLINHYLRKFYYGDSSNKENFYFKSDSIDPYDKSTNHLLKYIYGVIVTNHLFIDEANGDLIFLKSTSTSEDFTYELLMALFFELEYYFNQRTLDRKFRFYKMAEERTKELRSKLSSAEMNYINFVNTNGAEAGGRNNILVQTQFKATDLRKATESYFLALGSKEAAWVSYQEQKQTPAMAVIDPPLYPLAKSVPNPLLHLIFGIIAGAGLTIIGIIGQKFIRDYLKKEKELEQKNMEEGNQAQV